MADSGLNHEQRAIGERAVEQRAVEEKAAQQVTEESRQSGEQQQLQVTDESRSGGEQQPKLNVPDIRKVWRERVVIGDGAMATMLHQSGVPIRTCYEELSVSHPKLVRDVHLAYIAAGADVIQTNTFGAHRIGLARYGLEARLQEINRAAVHVAREAAESVEKAVWVFGTIGSTADLGYHKEDEEAAYTLRDVFGEQLDALLSAGVDGIILETFADLDEMLLALDVVRSKTDLPIIATLSPDAPEVTRDGVPVAEAFAKMQDAGADVVGLNCRLGLAGILRSYERLPHVPGTVYAAVPNAGLLHITEGDVTYTAGANYFADMGKRLVETGVHFVGGCCGTTPSHIQKLAATVGLSAVSHGLADGLVVGGQTSTRGPEKPGTTGNSTADLDKSGTTETNTIGNSTTDPDKSSTTGTHATAPEKSSTITSSGNIPTVVSQSGGSSSSTTHPDRVRIYPHDGVEATMWEESLLDETLLDKVKQRRTVIVELDPPRTTDLSRYLAGARALKEAGVDSITLADNSLGTVRVSNMAIAAMLKPMGIDPLVHVTCRDRNLIGQQSHLMGLHVLGIHHILLVTGDPSRFGDLPGATSVYDVSSIDLTRMVRRLNEGIAFSGQPLKQPAKFVVGTSFNPHVRNFEKAVERLKRKVDAGADYVMTQPVYDERVMEAVAKATEPLGVPVFIGVMPLVSARNALFLHNEVPGMQIPEDILNQMTEASPDNATELGLEIAEALTNKAAEYFNGLYLMTPFLRYDLTVRLTKMAKARADVAL